MIKVSVGQRRLRKNPIHVHGTHVCEAAATACCQQISQSQRSSCLVLHVFAVLWFYLVKEGQWKAKVSFPQEPIPPYLYEIKRLYRLCDPYLQHDLDHIVKVTQVNCSILNQIWKWQIFTPEGLQASSPAYIISTSDPLLMCDPVLYCYYNFVTYIFITFILKK